MINKLEKYLYDCIHFTTDNINNYLKENYNNFNILIIDNNSIENDKDLFNSIANVMKFPDYFGKNWDALDECLRDLDWLELKEGLILVILNSKKYGKDVR